MGGCGKWHWNREEKQRIWDRVWKEELEVWRTGWRHREGGKKEITKIQRTQNTSL